jgi:adenine-specific DNA glycosylase
LLLLGRYVCLAKGPKCEDCPLFEICPSRQGQALGTWQERARHTGELIQGGTAAG